MSKKPSRFSNIQARIELPEYVPCQFMRAIPVLVLGQRFKIPVPFFVLSYGSIKYWMGSTHFLMRRLPNVQEELSLHELTYNLRRAINILGVPRIMEQLQAA